MPFKPSDVVHYNRTTAPFPLEIEPSKYLRIFIENFFYEHQNATLWSIYQNDTIKSILNSVGNISFRSDVSEEARIGGIHIWSTADNIRTFLSNLSFSGPPVAKFSQYFRFYNSTNYRDIFGTAERFFVPWDTLAPTPQDLGIIDPFKLTFGSLGVGALICFSIAGGLYYGQIRNITLADASEDNNGDVVIEMLGRDDDAPDYQAVSQELKQITDPGTRQDLAWAAIQRFKRSLNHNDLFGLCNYIGSTHPCYDRTVQIQANCLDEMLKIDGIGSSFKDLFLQKFNEVEDVVRRQDVTWQYIQKYKEEIRSKGTQVLFDMYDLIEDREENTSKDEETLKEILVQDSKISMTYEDSEENASNDEDAFSSHVESFKKILVQDSEIATPLAWYLVSENKEPKKIAKPSRYEESLSLQAECLRDILEQDPDARDFINIYEIKMNSELKRIDNLKRRQDLVFQLIVNSNLPLDTRVNLCDQIQKDHSHYNRTIIEKAHLITANSNLSDDDRFEKAMLTLIELHYDNVAKEFRRTFLEAYWRTNVGGELPKVLIDPQTEQQFRELKLYIQEQKKLKESQEGAVRK